MYFVAGPSSEVGGFIRGHIPKENWLSLPWQPPAQLGWGLVHPPDARWNGDWPGEVIFKIFIFLPLQALRCAPMRAAAASGWGIFPSSVTAPSFHVYFLWTYTQHSVTQTNYAASTKLMEQEHRRDPAWLTPGRAGLTATGWSCCTQHGAFYLCQ